MLLVRMGLFKGAQAHAANRQEGNHQHAVCKAGKGSSAPRGRVCVSLQACTDYCMAVESPCRKLLHSLTPKEACRRADGALAGPCPC